MSHTWFLISTNAAFMNFSRYKVYFELSCVNKWTVPAEREPTQNNY